MSPKHLQNLLTNQNTADYRVLEISVGHLPEYRVGQIYQGGNVVAELPQESAEIVLQNINWQRDVKRFDDLQPAMGNWDKKYSYYILNRTDYFGLGFRAEDGQENSNAKIDFRKSCCIVHEVDGVQFIIPMSVIFQRFYAPQTLIAHTFCNNTWRAGWEDLVCINELASGLKTGINPVDKTWEIVLRQKIDLLFAPSLALFQFDEYAQRAANHVYGNRANYLHKKPAVPWHVNVQIPFDLSREAVCLGVKGLPLTNKFSGQKKFLVTQITGCSWPSYFPKSIKTIHDIDSSQGEVIELMVKPPPFAGVANTSTPAKGGVDIQAGGSPNKGVVAQTLGHQEMYWTNAPQISKLKKQKSIRYVGPSSGAAGDYEKPDVVSTGNAYHNEGGPGRLHIHNIVRVDRVDNFVALLNIFTKLKDSERLTNFSVYGPEDDTQLIMAGDVRCWNFFNEKSRSDGFYPHRGWEIYTRKGQLRWEKGVPRAALIIEYEFRGKRYYWIEIQARPEDGYVSLRLRGEEEITQAQISSLLCEIAGVDGRRLSAPLRNLIRQSGWNMKVDLFPHRYSRSEMGDGTQRYELDVYETGARILD